jgi:excisionase family DNA binding protein
MYSIPDHRQYELGLAMSDDDSQSLQRKTYTVEEAGKLLGMSRNAAYGAARQNKIPGLIRIGHRVFVSRAALDRLLQCGSAP